MDLGTVASLWRYPVKSLQGERLEHALLGPDGIPGDRGVAIVDVESGRVISGKRVQMLLTARAVARPGGPVVVLPDGRSAHTSDPTIDDLLSEWLGRRVHVSNAGPEEERPLIESDSGQVFLGRPGSYFDSSALHLLTTASLAHLAGLYPEGAFDERRFRPNLVVDTGGAQGIVEQGWIGRRVRLGGALLEITRPCTRCVMTTSEQADLPKDPGILRTVARETDNTVGVFATTVEPGWAAVGDQVERAD